VTLEPQLLIKPMTIQEFQQQVIAKFNQATFEFNKYKAITYDRQSITYHQEWGWLVIDEMGFSGRGDTLDNACINCKRTRTDHQEWIDGLLGRLQQPTN
jgi:hypothetical protein